MSVGIIRREIVTPKGVHFRMGEPVDVVRKSVEFGTHRTLYFVQSPVGEFKEVLTEEDVEEVHR